jgi:hypothetical protein
MGHEPVRGGAVPVLFAGLEEHTVVSTQTVPVNHSLGPAFVSMEFLVMCMVFS